jgi:pimeloyl-ACP methyl ester carboxylesterase
MRRQLLLLPGLNNTRAVFDGVVDALGEVADVHIFEFPPLDTVEALADDVLRRAPQRFHLVGFSFGGYVAAAMLARAPERVHALAFIGSSPAADAPERRPMREAAIAGAQAGKYEEMIKAQGAAAFHPNSLADQDLMARRAAMVSGYGAERFIAHTRASMARPARYDALAALNTPLLVMGGETDPLAPLAEMNKTAAAAAKSRVVVIPGAGHLAPMEKPQLVAQELVRWLQEP